MNLVAYHSKIKVRIIGFTKAEVFKMMASILRTLSCKKMLILLILIIKEGQSVQFSSVAQSCLTLCDPMNRSMPGLPVHHQLPEFTQTHVHRVRDAIQPSHSLSSPSPPAPNSSQHQSLFQWVNSSHEAAKVLELQLSRHSFQRTPRTDLLQKELVGLGRLLFWKWAPGVSCIYLRLNRCQLLHLLLFSPILKAAFPPCL